MNLNELELESFAKINLHLDITGKLDNGFHELYSVFQLISLSDRIKIRIYSKENSAGKNRISIKGNFSCRPEENLIYRVISDFVDKTGLNNKYEIEVKKNIPEGGGLGGGSSNAAYVLHSLNRMTGSPLNEFQLLQIAENNGSDIPFFLKAVTAVVRGRGENISPVDADLTGYNLVLTCPDFKISTKDAYNLLDINNIYDFKSFDYSAEQVSRLLEKNPAEWGFFNSFTPVLKEKEPVFNKIFSIFENSGSEYYNITGSGSAVYGIFKSSENSFKAEKELKTTFPFVWNGKMLAGKPLLDK